MTKKTYLQLLFASPGFQQPGFPGVGMGGTKVEWVGLMMHFRPPTASLNFYLLPLLIIKHRVLMWGTLLQNCHNYSSDWLSEVCAALKAEPVLLSVSLESMPSFNSPCCLGSTNMMHIPRGSLPWTPTRLTWSCANAAMTFVPQRLTWSSVKCQFTRPKVTICWLLPISSWKYKKVHLGGCCKASTTGLSHFLRGRTAVAVH